MTMDCLEFRRAAGADPRHPGAESVAHGDACPRCAEFQRQMLALDEKILAALRVPVPDAALPGRSQRVVRLPVIERRRWLALAASIVGGVLVGSLLWVSEPRTSLAQDVVAHMGHEPGVMIATHDPADPAEIAAVLERGAIRLRPEVGTVSYASTCRFRGERVPHLVVQTDAGPVTVMVLRHEKVTAPVKFNEQGYAGTILPAGPGSIAVIGRVDAAGLGQVAERVRDAVEWQRG
jgi:hypothetical protein